ncbi:AAA family ATPase [Paraburkholderia sediminicola]|uniref:AAA family ATPase n=1 Tax=Paraburkholderia rhynchosiae TaxID=487049 RepID=A0ACC7NBN0_9BURK
MRSIEVPDARSEPSLSIRLLGEIKVTRNGAGVPLPASRRTRALLGYLVSADGEVARSTLCDLLWDGPGDPRAALRWSLSKLRVVVDDASHTRIVADRAHVAFSAADTCIDTLRVQTLLAPGIDRMPLAALEEAARLLRGEFLGGLNLPTCYRFHNWGVGQRERYGRMREAVLRSLVGMSAAEPLVALQYCRELVEADPVSESAHATLVRLLDAAGRCSEAEEHYAYARDLVRRELRTGACAILDEAIRHVRQHPRHRAANADLNSTVPETTGLTVAGQERASANGSMADTVGAAPAKEKQREPASHEDGAFLPPFVGRRQERSMLDGLCQAASPGNRLTLLTGEPGIGKTRLLEYLSEQTQRAGYIVLRGRCYEAEMIRPYGIWIDALRAVSVNELQAAGDNVAPLVCPKAISAAESQGDSGNRERFFAAVVTLLERLCARHRLAIVLDDLQWLDEASAALLHFVLRKLDSQSPVVFAAAARAAGMDDNWWARTLVQSLSRENKLTRVPLTPLAAADVASLLAASGNDIGVDEVLRQSGGNPLYVLELARAETARENGSARTVDALISSRLDPLDRVTRELLTFAAAIGREFSPEQLAELLDRTLGDVLFCVAELERHGLLAPVTETQFDFAHDLVRQTVYRTLSQPHKRAIHHQIARQLLAASTHDPRLYGEVVHHATMADDPRMTARASIDASNHCLRVFAVAEARAVAERGLAHARALPAGGERVHLEIQLLTASLVAAASSGDRQSGSLMQELEQAVREAQALSLHAEAVQGLHSLSWLTQQANDIERTRQVTLEAEREARRADAATRCKQLANTGRCLLELERNLPRARAVLGEASTLAEQLDLRVLELMWGEALLARADGQLDIACARISDAVEQSRLTGDHWREYQCLVWLATLDLEREAYAEVIPLAGSIVTAAQRMGDSGAPYADVIREISALRLGASDPREARFQGLAGLREADDKRHLCYALNEVARVLLDWHCDEAAKAYAAEALQAAEILNSTTEIIVATANLIETTFASGEDERAMHHLLSLRERVGEHWLSPRGEAAIRRLRLRHPMTTTIISTAMK